MKSLSNIKQIVTQLYDFLQPYCIAIYLGGSICENIIEKSHDIDIICFSDLPREMYNIRRDIQKFLKEYDVPTDYDFIQVRTKQREEHAYGSYINKKMVKLIGEDIDFKFDVINDNRIEYIQILKDTVEKILSGKIKNQKRWYQIYRGICILVNNSYEVTTEQKREINILHDLSDGWEEIKDKTINLLANLK